MLVLLIALMLAYGALVNSLGLAVAVWVQRFGVALGVTVTIYVLLTAGPVLLLLASNRMGLRGFASGSPWYGVGETTAHLGRYSDRNTGWKIFWLLVYATGALALAFATVRSFDRCIGRARSRS
jgi:hypothetical protein